jgi:hypothetical protein
MRRVLQVSRLSSVSFSKHGLNCVENGTGCPEHREAGGASTNNCSASRAAEPLFAFRIIFIKKTAHEPQISRKSVGEKLE